MKVLNSALLLFSLTAVAAAQSAGPPSQVVTSKPAASAPAAAPAKSPFAAPKTAAKPASASKTEAGKSAAKSAPQMPKSQATKGRRDPFVSPIVKAPTGLDASAACNAGKRCLDINQMVLRGIVKGQGGMIAVVENASHKTYFLREKDPVFNGFVMKITADSIIFKENLQDSAGRATSHEVVKSLAPPA